MRHCLLWTIPAFTTSTPTIAVAPRLLDQDTGPNEATRNNSNKTISGLRLHVFEFPDFSTFPPSPLVSCRVPAPQLACLVVSEVSLEVRLARWHANRHGAQNLEFLEVSQMLMTFSWSFSNLFEFFKAFSFQTDVMRTIQKVCHETSDTWVFYQSILCTASVFFLLALLSRGHRKGRVLRGPMRGPKTPLRHVQI